MRIIDKIRNRENFTPIESALASYLQEHPKEATNLSLNELSDTLHASKSSIIRFCKKLGYKGHKELCVQLAKELDTFVFNGKELNYSVPYELSDSKKMIADKTHAIVMGALNETWSDLDVDKLSKIAKMIHDKKKLYIYAAEDSFLLARDLYLRLEKIGMHVCLQETTGANITQACQEDSDSAALFIYYSNPSEELIRIAQILSSKNIYMVALTGPNKGPLTIYANDHILVPYYEPDPKICGFGSSTAMKFVIDVIYAYIFHMDYEKNLHDIKLVEETKRKFLINK